MSTALQYTVDADGRVTTDGIYREITEQDWQQLRPRPTAKRRRYDGALHAVSMGKIVAVPARDNRVAWNVVRSLLKAAERKGLAVEVRRAADPASARGELVLVRLAPGEGLVCGGQASNGGIAHGRTEALSTGDCGPRRASLDRFPRIW